MIEIKNISHTYNDMLILDNISISINMGERVAIMGPSGCGKSTLLKIISGLEDLNFGELKGIDSNIAFAFQDDRLLEWRSVWKNIELVRYRADHDRIQALINSVGLAGFEDYKPSALSGGMKKRLEIARTFYAKAKLVLMDEPFSGLDYYMRYEMIQLLLKVWEDGKPSIVFVTHEVDEALALADKILVFSSRPASLVREFNMTKNLRNPEDLDRIRGEIVSLLMEAI